MRRSSRAKIYLTANLNQEQMKAGKSDLVSGDLPRGVVPTSSPSLRRAKIICTVGPACDSEAMLRELMRLGMDVARLNFSHGTHQEHARNIQRLRRAAEKESRSICILQDLQGPKIRTGRLKGHDPVLLKNGSRVTITTRDVAGTPTLFSTTFFGPFPRGCPGPPGLLFVWLFELSLLPAPGAGI